MSEMKHTPGPWNVTANSWQYTTIYAADGTPICRLDLEDWDVTEDNQGDLEKVQASVAAMIVAAPEMLAALKWAESALAPFSKEPAEKSGMALIRAAIAKAEGRQP